MNLWSPKKIMKITVNLCTPSQAWCPPKKPVCHKMRRSQWEHFECIASPVTKLAEGWQFLKRHSSWQPDGSNTQGEERNWRAPRFSGKDTEYDRFQKGKRWSGATRKIMTSLDMSRWPLQHLLFNALNSDKYLMLSVTCRAREACTFHKASISTSLR